MNVYVYITLSKIIIIISLDHKTSKVHHFSINGDHKTKQQNTHAQDTKHQEDQTGHTLGLKQMVVVTVTQAVDEVER